MALSTYRASVAAAKRVLGSLASIIDKAEAHASLKKIEPNALLMARLAPDMFHFIRQVQATTDQARALARLAGVEPLKIENTETSFSDLKARIARTVDFLDTLQRDAIDGAADQTLSVPFGGQAMQINGADYLLNFVLPNFFFHATTAYDILRHNGVDIGKRDFLGMR
jgi:hypothetical protein